MKVVRNTLISLSFLLLPGAVRAAEPDAVQLTQEEEALFTQASTNCTHWGSKDVGDERRKLLQRLLVIERDLDFPVEARGLLLAAACRESSYTPSAKGDCWRQWLDGQPVGGKCSSLGIVQFASWAKKGIRKWQVKLGHEVKPDADPRLDWVASAYFWGERFLSSLHKVKSQCHYQPWQWNNKKNAQYYGSRMYRYVAAANASSVRYPKCGKYHYNKETKAVYCMNWLPRCMEATLHYHELRKWHRNIAEGVPPSGIEVPEVPVVGLGE